jgi:hypothetical protein
MAQGSDGRQGIFRFQKRNQGRHGARCGRADFPWRCCRHPPERPADPSGQALWVSMLTTGQLDELGVELSFVTSPRPTSA